jgi:hypothetical membrane protein
MSDRRIWPGLFGLAGAGVLAFVVLTVMSVFLYPGGTYRDHTTAGYSFFRNFLSDLGMPQSWDGRSNPLGAALFVSAEVLLAIALVAFFVGFVRLLSTSPRARGFSRAAAGAALVACLALVVASVTPANRFQTIHVEAALLVFRASFVATGLLALAIARDGRFAPATVLIALLLPVALAVYIGVLELGPSARRSDVGLAFQATSQKVILMILLPGIAYLSTHGARVAPRTLDRVPERSVA